MEIVIHNWKNRNGITIHIRSHKYYRQKHYVKNGRKIYDEKDSLKDLKR